MTGSLVITRWGRTCLGTLLLSLAALGASAASPKRVLMVFREDGHVLATAVSSAGEVSPESPLALKP